MQGGKSAIIALQHFECSKVLLDECYVLLCNVTYITDTSIAARGGGGSFKRLKLYNSEEHVPIESFVTTLIH